VFLKVQFIKMVLTRLIYVVLVPAPTIFANQLPCFVHAKAKYAFAIPYFVAAIATIEIAMACYGF
jgi:hypothetical protein